MRWDKLFADIEAQVADDALATRDDEVNALVEGEEASRSWHECMPAGHVRLRVCGYGYLDGVVQRLTAQWLLLSHPSFEALVNNLAIAEVVAPASRSRPLSHVDQRASWVVAVRMLQRERSRIHVVARDGSSIGGVVRSAGHNFVEVLTDQDATTMIPYRHISLIINRDGRPSLG